MTSKRRVKKSEVTTIEGNNMEASDFGTLVFGLTATLRFNPGDPQLWGAVAGVSRAQRHAHQGGSREGLLPAFGS